MRPRAPIGPDSSRTAEEPCRQHSDTLSTVQHALRVLELVTARDGMTPKQLAAELDLKLGTVYHLVNTLLDDGYLARTTGGRFISAIACRSCSSVSISVSTRSPSSARSSRGWPWRPVAPP